ncbi:MAG: hypothetical protein LBH92_00940 [Bacteroidales bacterium]|jgi:hypothetical protein|nr:hypothetical protein [Bacteroidales bacterium]
MKKIGIYFLSLALVAMTFVACGGDKPDDNKIAAPVITINGGADIEIEWTTIAELKIPVKVISEAEKMERIQVIITDENGKEYTVEDIKTFTKPDTNKEVNREYTITELAVIITQLQSGQVAPKDFIVKAYTTTYYPETKSQAFKLPDIPEPPQTPLSDPKDFTWHRVSSNDGTGLAQFGLEWKSNTATHIIITPVAGAKLVELTEADWTEITTQKGLAEVVNEKEGISKWEVIPAKTTFNYVIATRTAEGKYFLINPTERTINPNDGGDRTISGKYKE